MSVSESLKIVCCFGVDVSKLTLDVALWLKEGKPRWRKFDNNLRGFDALLRWARKVAKETHGRSGAEIELRFCMESTADYGVWLALYLTEQEVFVSIENPARIKAFGVGEGRITKTDKADSVTISQYAAGRDLAPWPLADPTRRAVFRLQRRRDQLAASIVVEQNRMECPEAIGADCTSSIQTVLKALRQELRSVKAKLKTLIEQTPELQRKAELLGSMGLGSASTTLLLAEMPPVEEVESASRYAAVAGVQPTAKCSGNRQPESSPMSRAGKRSVRRGLWMATFWLRKRCPEIGDLYDRLRAKGKKHKQAMIACIRKALMIAYGILKSGKPYECRKKEPVIACA